MGQSAFQYFSCPFPSRGFESAGSGKDVAGREICPRGYRSRQVSLTALHSFWRIEELTRLGDSFHKMLATDEMRAWYGPEHVALAVDRGAVGTLLISDDLFRRASF